MNTKITQEAIAEFRTSPPDENIIPAHFQIPRMGRQRGFNSVATNNGVSATVSDSPNGFLSSMKTMAGFQVLEVQKSQPETVMYLQIIPPSMIVR